MKCPHCGKVITNVYKRTERGILLNHTSSKKKHRQYQDESKLHASNHGSPWSGDDVSNLQLMASQGATKAEVANSLGRTWASVNAKAVELEVSFYTKEKAHRFLSNTTVLMGRKSGKEV